MAEYCCEELERISNELYMNDNNTMGIDIVWDYDGKLYIEMKYCPFCGKKFYYYVTKGARES